MFIDQTWSNRYKYAYLCSWVYVGLTFLDLNWCVVSIIFYFPHFSIIYGIILPIDFHIFSRWLKPPTCEDMGMDQYLLTPFLGGLTSIYQIFWCELQGYKVLTHCHRSQSFLATKKASALLEELLARHSRQLPPFSAGLKGGSGDESLEWC